MSKPTPGVDFSGKQLDAESVLNHQAQNAENAEQKMAFELYYRAGAERSYPKVAEQTGRHLNTIQLWATKLRWNARIHEREKIAAEHSLTVQKIVQEQDLKKKHVNIYDVAITKAVQEIAEGRVKIKTIQEMIQLIDARWKLAAAAAPSANTPSMHFHGPTQVDLGLEKMNREERIKFACRRGHLWAAGR
jgi:transposase